MYLSDVLSRVMYWEKTASDYKNKACKNHKVRLDSYNSQSTCYVIYQLYNTCFD